MPNIQLVVFDIAGTTVFDKGDIAVAFIEGFRKHGKDISVEEVNKVMGFRKKDAIKSLLDRFYPDQEDADEVIEKIHDAFVDNIISFYKTDPDLRPLPYAVETFQTLKAEGVKVALNTGFTKAITATILSRLGWNESLMLDYIISSDEVPQGRPHPYMIRTIMEALAITNVKQVAKVGDTQVDIQEGRNAGCGLVISITTGAYTREQLESYDPDFIIDSLEELPALIK